MRGGRSESQVRGGAHVIGDTSIVLPFGVVLTQVHWQLREDGIAVDVVDPEERHRVEIDRERRGEHGVLLHNLRAELFGVERHEVELLRRRQVVRRAHPARVLDDAVVVLAQPNVLVDPPRVERADLRETEALPHRVAQVIPVVVVVRVVSRE